MVLLQDIKGRDNRSNLASHLQAADFKFCCSQPYSNLYLPAVIKVLLFIYFLKAF